MAKKIFRSIKIVLIVFALVIVCFGAFIMLGKQKAMDLQIKNISIQSLPDGTYTGVYSGFRWSNTVDVKIFDHKIVDINVVKKQLLAKPETVDQIKQEIISRQTLDIDVVNGATADTKAYLKAVENALNR